MKPVMGGRALKECDGDGCGKKIRRHRVDKKTGKILCFGCSRKTVHVINSDTSKSKTN